MKDAFLLFAIATPWLIGLGVLGWGIITLPLAVFVGRTIRGPARTVYDDVDAMRREREAQERAARAGLYRPSGRVETSTVNAPRRSNVRGATDGKGPHR